IILEEGWQANRIITDLLDYARVRAPERKACDARALVEQALMSQPVPSVITLEKAFTEVPLVSIDPDQVRDAVANLIRNAVEAMPDGGTLQIGVYERDGEVMISIGDTGPGIPREVKDRLFEPLVTTKPLGLGLGLTTTRALIQNQGGSIACESA